MKTIDQYNFADKKALIRVDFNVPLNDKYEVTDDNRIKATIPTIQKILMEGGAVILMSHLGRPKGGYEEKYSLRHLVKTLSTTFDRQVKFAEDCIGDQAVQLAKDLKPSEVLLLENLRFYKEEEKGDEVFAKKLARLGDVYVNDAFGTAHRAHASTAVIARFFKDKVCGYVMQAELENAQKVLDNVERPYTAIMGGAKISDKILIIERLLDKVDNLIIGGGMSYTFFKAMGGNIEKARSKNINLMLPPDSVIADAFKNEANQAIADNTNIKDGWMGLDIGPKAIQAFTKVIENSKTVLWNGPMGVFEMSSFAKGTESVAKAVVKATENGGFSLIGGGDSAAAINQLGSASQQSF